MPIEIDSSGLFIFEDIVQSFEKFMINFIGYDIASQSGSHGSDGIITFNYHNTNFSCWISECTQAIGLLLGR